MHHYCLFQVLPLMASIVTDNIFLYLNKLPFTAKLYQTHLHTFVELECRLGTRSLTHLILRHQNGHEGDLDLHGILLEDMSRQESEHQGVIEHDYFFQEYNFLNA